MCRMWLQWDKVNQVYQEKVATLTYMSVPCTYVCSPYYLVHVINLVDLAHRYKWHVWCRCLEHSSVRLSCHSYFLFLTIERTCHQCIHELAIVWSRVEWQG